MKPMYYDRGKFRKLWNQEKKKKTSLEGGAQVRKGGRGVVALQFNRNEINRKQEGAHTRGEQTEKMAENNCEFSHGYVRYNQNLGKCPAVLAEGCRL